MFSKAIVKRPCKNLLNGIISANLGKPDYKLAVKQHNQYIDVLKQLGLEVIILNADENYPDSVFVEDTALLTPHFAVITNPGADSRRGEIFEMNQVLENLFPMIESISTPGTLDAGDVMMVGNHFYIGLSDRTNLFGANQLIGILAKFGLLGSTVPLKNILHLKSGASYLENNTLLLRAEFLNKKEFQKFNKIVVDENESYAANSIWINDRVLVPEGFPVTKRKIEQAGYDVIEVDVSEFRKLDGGLSCLSLRY